jgi:choice-of-anchor B domain-containing protein
MRYLILRAFLLFILLASIAAPASADLRVTLRGHLDPLAGDFRYADVWGEGHYAYLATYNTPAPDTNRGSGVLIIDIANPDDPQVVGQYLPASGARFQDVVVINGIGYFSSENAGGVHIVDVRNPASPQLLSQITTAQSGFSFVHEIAVADGILYEADSRGTIVKAFDVRNPSAPAFIRNIQTTDTYFIHAITALNGRLYTSGWNGNTDIFDVRNILTAAPSLLGTVVSGDRSHSSWVGSDGRLLVSARETINGDVRVFDISDPAHPVLRSTITAQSLGISAFSPHNPYLVGHLLFVSWYQAGLQVIDLSDPAAPVRVGEFDTYADPTVTGFRGNWGVYPFLGLDRVLLSDMDGGLYIVDATDLPVGLEGDAAPRPNGNRILGISDWVQVGRFAVGLDTPSTQDGEFQRADCAPQTTGGDGRIGLTDWVQAGRYSAAIDGPQPASGPSGPVDSLELAVSVDPQANRFPRTRLPDLARRVLLSPIAVEPAEIQYAVKINGRGDENAIAFTIEFNPAELQFIGSALDNGATMHVNKNERGRIGIALALPTGRTFDADSGLVALQFLRLSRNGPPLIQFVDGAVKSEVVTVNAQSVPAVFGVEATRGIRKR